MVRGASAPSTRGSAALSATSLFFKAFPPVFIFSVHFTRARGPHPKRPIGMGLLRASQRSWQFDLGVRAAWTRFPKRRRAAFLFSKYYIPARAALDEEPVFFFLRVWPVKFTITEDQRWPVTGQRWSFHIHLDMSSASIGASNSCPWVDAGPHSVPAHSGMALQG